MQGKTGAQPTVGYKIPKPGTPNPKLDLSDMDHTHRLVASGALADILARIGKPK